MTQFVKESFRESASKLMLLTRNVERTEDGITYVPLWKWMLGLSG